MIHTETEMFTDYLARLVDKSPQVQLLITIPGVDFPTAQSILAMIGDWSRFPQSQVIRPLGATQTYSYL